MFVSLAVPQLKYKPSADVTLGVGLLPSLSFYKQESKIKTRPQIGAALVFTYKHWSLISANVWETNLQQWIWANGVGYRL